jgi:hypothetical protein
MSYSNPKRRRQTRRLRVWKTRWHFIQFELVEIDLWET